MWRRNAVAVLLLVSRLASSGSAYEREPTSLLSKQKWVRFDVVRGRVTATHVRGGQGRQSRESEEASTRELLAVNVHGVYPSIRYERTDRIRSVTVEISNQSALRIVASPTDSLETPAVRFRQLAGEPLVLNVSHGDREVEHRADSLWHLMLKEPAVCAQHLVPLLGLLRTDWGLVASAETIESQLFASAARGAPVDPRQVALQVERLNDDEFATRQAADRKLRGLGISILPYLDEVCGGPLSGEQKVRIQHIRAFVCMNTPDTACRAAAWLMHDKTIWLELLSHRESAKRRVAAAHLNHMHDGEIRFDPNAKEARRNEQVARLRMQLVEK